MRKTGAGFGLKHPASKEMVPVESVASDPIPPIDKMLPLELQRGQSRNGLFLTSQGLQPEVGHTAMKENPKE